MGRYKSTQITVRDLSELIIVFWSNSSVYVYPKRQGQVPVVFHKWFAPRFTYSNGWRQFRDLLWRSRAPTLQYCFETAERYGILYKSVVGRLDFEKKPVEVKYQRWSIKGVCNAVHQETQNATGENNRRY